MKRTQIMMTITFIFGVAILWNMIKTFHKPMFWYWFWLYIANELFRFKLIKLRKKECLKK